MQHKPCDPAVNYSRKQCLTTQLLTLEIFVPEILDPQAELIDPLSAGLASWRLASWRNLA